MSSEITGTLHELGDTDQTVADPDDDVRGRVVVDRDDQEVGRVDGLLIDDGRRVRFLRVAEGGLLGFLATHYLVPVEAVVAVDPDCVRIDTQRSGMTDVPGYDPELATLPTYYGTVYGWWGVPPYWGVYPR
ncbi:PRC-barrel domain-containing protein [Blastococcus aggregatus]|uniref:PRC-barrel domain-containing protein n=1 Tax=Blastococcus aggregatus TaxID=38502 RepID=A0A285V927_9ACTN|nr:PRC-barrel domain-containing protein [Blastococcus aggregatus]SOC50088.1 PRC-barrel domain-containing protein [Blastococcus aggregatus]